MYAHGCAPNVGCAERACVAVGRRRVRPFRVLAMLSSVAMSSVGWRSLPLVLMRVRKAAKLVASVGLVIVVSATAAADWPVARHDPRRTGVSSIGSDLKKPA